MKRRVLILSPFFSPNLGGVETHLDDLSEYLMKNDYDVSVITYQPLTTDAKGKSLERKENLEIHRVGWIGYGLFHRFEEYPLIQFLYLTPILLMYTLYFLLKNRGSVRFIHAHGMNAAFIANIARKIFGLNYVVSMHAIYHFDRKPILSTLCYWILAPAIQIFCLAERSRQDLIHTGLPQEKLSLYVQWVDQSVFTPRDKTECRKKTGLPDGFIVLLVGRLIEKKGTLVLADVAKTLPEIKFVFVGDGPTRGELETLSKTHTNIIAVGKVPKMELYYGAADMKAVPSQYEEGFARVVLESLSSGTPVIASNKGCLPEMITPDVGAVIDPSVENFRQKIKFIYDNPGELERLANNCRKYAVENFSEKNAEHIVSFYRA